MEFDEAFDRTVGPMTGWTRDPRDPDCWTGGRVRDGELRGIRYGIRAARHPELDIEHLTLDGAREIYRRDVWDRCACDQLPDWIRLPIFDIARCAEVMIAIGWLQRAVGATVDGVVSCRTVAAARAANPGIAIARLSAQFLDDLARSPRWESHGREAVRKIAKAMLEMEV